MSEHCTHQVILWNINSWVFVCLTLAYTRHLFTWWQKSTHYSTGRVTHDPLNNNQHLRVIEFRKLCRLLFTISNGHGLGVGARKCSSVESSSSFPRPTRLGIRPMGAPSVYMWIYYSGFLNEGTRFGIHASLYLDFEIFFCLCMEICLGFVSFHQMQRVTSNKTTSEALFHPTQPVVYRGDLLVAHCCAIYHP